VLHRVICFVALSAQAQPVPEAVGALLQNNCIECHDAEVKKGGLDLEALSAAGVTAESLPKWIKAFQRTEHGEMPPQTKNGPGMEKMEREQLVASLAPVLMPLAKAARAGAVRTGLRRLNADQFNHSLAALLGPTPAYPLFKEETPVGVFDTEDRVLRSAESQLNDFLRCIAAATSAAVDRIMAKRSSQTWQLTPMDLLRSERELESFALAMDGKDLLVFLVGREGINTLMTHRWSAPAAGHYRVRLQASSFQSESPQPIKLMVGVVEEFQTMRTIGYADAKAGEPQWLSYEMKLDAGEGLRFERADSERGPYRHDKVDPKNTKLKAARYRALEIQGPFSHASDDAEPVLDQLMDRHPTWADQLSPLLEDIARVAYRRKDVSGLLTEALAAAAKQTKAEDRLKDGLRVLLCSPHFLLHQEAAGTLSAEQLASRLAFLLTTRLPDAELSAVGESLLQPEVLHAQTTRLLSSPRFETMVQRLADQWLQMNQIDFTDPDQRLYPRWDLHLRDSSLAETREFLNAAFRDNMPAKDLIQSDYTYANARMASHYGANEIAPIVGEEMRKVSFLPGAHRGGVLTHASVLKVSADGTTTNPILRGLWVKRHLLDQHPPPPPPGIPAVEPDIRGARTIRDMIALHKKSSSCASCHAHIDPYGLALEAFDPVGRWRTSYTVLDEKAPRGARQGHAVDPSGVLPDGTTFQSVRELRQALAAEPDLIASAILRKLTAYATGHAVEFADRPEIEAILNQTRAQGHRCQDLLHALIQSPLFRHR
jgi:hypothetical protein